MNTITKEQQQIEEVRSALTVPNFRRWLQNHPNQENVGTIKSCGSCPIAMFLIETIGQPDISVCEDTIEQEQENGVVYFSNYKHGKYASAPFVPRWVSQFIDRVDRLFRKGYIKVSAAQALDILNLVEEFVA